MVADIDIVQDRIARVRNEIRLLKQFREISLEDFLTNEERQRAVLHSLQLALEGCSDIALHICADDSLGNPSTYAESFQFLERGKVISSKIASEMSLAVGLRNRIVHNYSTIDLERILRLTHEQLGTLERYLAEIEQYLN